MNAGLSFVHRYEPVVRQERPPLLLLHGNPLTHVSWHKIAPRLAEKFTVVATDLRGYGDSTKPAGGERSIGYSFRAMAEDQESCGFSEDCEQEDAADDRCREGGEARPPFADVKQMMSPALLLSACATPCAEREHETSNACEDA